MRTDAEEGRKYRRDLEIGRLLRLARLDRMLSVTELANLGAPVDSTIFDMEYGHSLSDENIEKICKALNVDVIDMMQMRYKPTSELNQRERQSAVSPIVEYRFRHVSKKELANEGAAITSIYQFAKNKRRMQIVTMRQALQALKIPIEVFTSDDFRKKYIEDIAEEAKKENDGEIAEAMKIGACAYGWRS